MVMHSSTSKANGGLKNSDIVLSPSKTSVRAKHMQLQAPNYDRPGISELLNSRDPRLKKKYEEKPVPIISKREYVEKWLFNYNDSDSASTGSSVVFDSPSPKRAPLSPLKNFKGSKRIKADCDEYIKSKINENSPRKSKENHTDLRRQFFELHHSKKVPEKFERTDNQRDFCVSDKNTRNRNLERDFLQNKNPDNVDKFLIYSHSTKRLSPSKKYFKPVSPQIHGKTVSHFLKSKRLVAKFEDKWRMIQRFDKINEKLPIDNIETSDDEETDESPIITDLESPNPSPCYLDNYPSIDSPLAVELQSCASSQANIELIDCNSSETNELNRTVSSEQNEIILNEVIEDSGSCTGIPVNQDNNNRHISIGNDDSLSENKSSSKSSIKSECNVAISDDASDNLDVTFCAEAEALDIAIHDEIEEVENIAPKNLIRSVEEVEDLRVVDEVSNDEDGAGEEEANVDRTLIAEEFSQKISQGSSSTPASNQLMDKSVTNYISLEASPPSNKKSEVSNQTIIPTVVKRRRKPKKGSLAARLQNLITSQMAFLRIWRHQMNQDQSMKFTSQSVQIKVNRCIWQCGRQYLFGTIVKDKFNLLVKVNQRSDLSSISNNSKNNLLNLSNASNSSFFLTKPITVLIDPVAGKINFNNRNILNIYQPWEVIDAHKLTLSVLYFNISDVDNREDNNGDQWSNTQKQDEVQQFNCPCLSAQRLVQSCDVKFTNMKPSVIESIFDDSYFA